MNFLLYSYLISVYYVICKYIHIYIGNINSYLKVDSIHFIWKIVTLLMTQIHFNPEILYSVYFL